MNIELKYVESEEKLKEVFSFFSNIFYTESKKYHEHYYPMGDRYYEMCEMLKKNNRLLVYAEANGKVIGCAIGKNLDLLNKKVTLSVLAVNQNYRNLKVATKLVQEFENICRNIGLQSISLGARWRACGFYEKLNYKPSFMVQVYDFVKIKEIRKNNLYEFKELESYQGETYGFIRYEVSSITEDYIKYFENKIPTAMVQYIFTKEL